MNSIRKVFYCLLLVFPFVIFSCGKDDEGTDDSTFLTNVNLFPVSKDQDLGLQVKQELENNPGEYNIMSRSQYPVAYAHLDSIMDAILNSGELKYRDEFAWETYLIQDDSTLNAFCTPGGYIYVYTGLIKFLDNESDLAGVLGHEIAHADQRHSTSQMTKLYGVEVLTQIALGQSSSTQIAEMAKNLINLKFSRSHETDADNQSVKYLCPTSYPADGAAAFFKKLIDLELTGGTPEFLSTHPSPENRVENIEAQKAAKTCLGENVYHDRYQDFKNSLP